MRDSVLVPTNMVIISPNNGEWRVFLSPIPSCNTPAAVFKNTTHQHTQLLYSYPALLGAEIAAVVTDVMQQLLTYVQLPA
jgi:hypothetical protein